MLRLRLRRVGKKNSPTFRLIVTPQRSGPKTGRFLEILGFYNPRKHEKVLEKERILYWIGKGAQPSKTVQNMLISEGVIEGRKVSVVHRKKGKKGEEKVPAPTAGDVAVSTPKVAPVKETVAAPKAA